MLIHLIGKSVRLIIQGHQERPLSDAMTSQDHTRCRIWHFTELPVVAANSC